MRPKIGLVLGGGGSRGIAHIGVLEVLQRERIPVDYLVGTSMGGIVAVLFALGYAPERIAHHMLTQMEGNNLLNLNLLSARGRQRLVQDQLAEAVGQKSFDALRIPTVLMAVDMLHGREVQLHSGPLMPAILATSAVPGVFPPVEIGGHWLSDGGVIDSLATHVAFQMGAQKVIAVDVYPELEKDNPWVDPLNAIIGLDFPFAENMLPDVWQKTPSAASAIWRSVRVITWHVHQQRLAAHPPDVLLRPAVDDYGSLDFRDVHGPLTAGLAVAESHLHELRALLEH
ncbi:MAG: patatin-like phospholipase family protein [Anaerolineales bacterium]